MTRPSKRMLALLAGAGIPLPDTPVIRRTHAGRHQRAGGASARHQNLERPQGEQVTIIRTASLVCDADDCDEWVGHDDAHAPVMRAEARRAGWTRRDGKDYCPEHGETGTEKTT